MRVFTIGHSTRTANDLCKILEAYHIATLVDVRSFPRSFTNPQFNKDVIGMELGRNGIEYAWLEKLGGRRKELGALSKNTCWRNKSFRNYADYMETDNFLKGARELIAMAESETPSIMCAEAVYWRCHRVMIADFLKSKGVEVSHIFNGSQLREHEYTKCARIAGGELTYHS